MQSRDACRWWPGRKKLMFMRGKKKTKNKKRAPHANTTEGPCTAYLRGDPMREVGGVGLLPALCRRRTACRRNVLRSRRKTTVSSLPGAVVVRHIIGQSDFPFSGRALQDIKVMLMTATAPSNTHNRTGGTTQKRL